LGLQVCGNFLRLREECGAGNFRFASKYGGFTRPLFHRSGKRAGQIHRIQHAEKFIRGQWATAETIFKSLPASVFKARSCARIS
jgi:hypothetical protein